MKIEEFIKTNPSFNIKQYGNRENGVVYFICEKDGLIIYIGSTMTPDSRFKTHYTRIEFYNKPIFFFWWPLLECEKLERELIKQIKPKYNIQIDTSRKILISKKTLLFKIKKAMATIMKEKNISPMKLAKLMNISRDRVSKILKGNAGSHKKNIKRFEELLGVRIELYL